MTLEFLLFLFWPLVWLCLTAFVALAMWFYALMAYIKKAKEMTRNTNSNRALKSGFKKVVECGSMIGIVFGGVICFVLLFALLVALWALFYVLSVLYTWV